MIAWLALIGAGILEAVWAVALSKIRGLGDWLPLSVFALAMALSLAGLAFAVRTLPVGTAYAVWTGIGAVCTAAFGMAFLDEPVNWPRVLCLLLIIGGVVGLHATSAATA